MLRTIETILHALRVPSVQDRERAYLNAARDIYDLEYRQRQIDNGLFRQNTYPGMLFGGAR